MSGNLTYIKDACGLAQAKGLPSLIHHEPAIEVRFVRGAAGPTSFLTKRRTPDTPVSRPIANLRSFGWQPHCRSLFQTPMAA
jgi:hypothetical protein